MATAKRIKSTTEYKNLLAVLKDDDKALAAYHRLHPEAKPEPKGDDPVAQLMAHGFTEEQARLSLATDAAEKVESAPKPLTSKERGEALVAERGLTFTKGRVYGGGALAEAIVRVGRTGKPEVVQSSGVGHTVGQLVYKEESGDVAIQNLAKPA